MGQTRKLEKNGVINEVARYVAILQSDVLSIILTTCRLISPFLFLFQLLQFWVFKINNKNDKSINFTHSVLIPSKSTIWTWIIQF